MRQRVLLSALDHGRAVAMKPERTTPQKRYCRSCGRLLMLSQFRLCRRGKPARRRTCRSCECREASVRRLERQGRSIPERFARPSVPTTRLMEIFERERSERRALRRQSRFGDRLPDHDDDLEDRWLD